MPRVLMVGLEWFDENPGGGGRYLADVAKGMAARGHAVTVLVPRLDPARPSREDLDGLTLLRYDGGGARSRLQAIWQAIPALVAEHGPFDVVHGHFALYALGPFWHPALRGARRVCQFQGPWAEESRVEGEGRVSVGAKYMIERAAYARARQFITLSDAFNQLLKRDYGVKGAVTTVPAGIDLAWFSPPTDRAAVRAALGWGDGPVVFCMRRLVRRMGLEVLIAAWPTVQAARPDARLVIAGRGPLEAELKRQAEGLAIAFAGRLPDEALVQHYQAADLTVVPTVALEGFGLITAESLACGTPVVGTKQGGTAEILAAFDPRLLVPPGDAGALAAGILAALAERPTSIDCRTFAERHFAWPRVLDRLEPLLVGA